MTRLSDEILDDALRVAASQLRDSELRRADTAEAWANFTSGRADDNIVTVRSAPMIRRRSWVAVAAAGLVAAAVLTVIWIRIRPPSIAPVDNPGPTVSVDTPTSQAPSTSVETSSTGSVATSTGQPLVLPTLPEGKVMASLSAVSDDEWFALTDYGPPDQESYPSLWHTLDAGADWIEIPMTDEVAGSAMSVHFADSANGWVLSSQCCIAATHDGGATWARIDGVTPRGELNGPPAIVSTGGHVYLLADVPVGGNSRVGVMSSPVQSDDFVWTGSTMGDVRWDLTPWSGQLVVRGGSGWAVAYGATAPTTTVDDGTGPPQGAARLVDGTWIEWSPPCAAPLQGEQMYTTIQVPRLVVGASPGGDTIALVCGGATVDAPPRTFVSHDKGATFAESASLPSTVALVQGSWVLMPDDTTILVGVELAAGELVVASSVDGGASWTIATSFGGPGEFVSAILTPSGQIVALATIRSSSSARTDTAQLRDPDGTWHTIASG